MSISCFVVNQSRAAAAMALTGSSFLRTKRTSVQRNLSFGAGWVTEKERKMEGPSGIFGSFANDYDRLRPSYPPTMFEAILAAAKRSCGWLPRKVADLGCGTGRGIISLAKHLERARDQDLSRASNVVESGSSGSTTTLYAVEPDQSMLDICMQNACDQGVACIPIKATAEHLDDLCDSSLDLCMSLQAWHWVDPEKGSAEIQRVLSNNGLLALAWNDRDLCVPWVRHFEELIQHLNPHYNMNDRQCDKYTTPLRHHPEFVFLGKHELPNPLVLSNWKALYELCMTFSYVRKVLPDKAAEASFRTSVHELIKKHVEDADAPFHLPLKTHLYLFRKAPR